KARLVHLQLPVTADPRPFPRTRWLAPAVWGTACWEANGARQDSRMGGIPMTIGAALALIVVGAILRFGITTSINGISIPTIGDILMIVGATSVVLWQTFCALWA